MLRQSVDPIAKRATNERNPTGHGNGEPTERLRVSHTTVLARLRTRTARVAFGLQVHTALVGLVGYLAAGGSPVVTDAQLAGRIGRSTNHVGVMMRAAAAEGWIERLPGDVTAHGRKPCRYRINAAAILDAIKAAVPEAARRRARETADTAARIAGLGPAYLAGHRRKRRKRPGQVHTTVSDTHDSLRSSSGAQGDAIDYGRPKNPGPDGLTAQTRRALRDKRTRLRRGSDDRGATA